MERAGLVGLPWICSKQGFRPLHPYSLLVGGEMDFDWGNLCQIVELLRKLATQIFDEGVFHQDEYGTFSATERDSRALEHAAEILEERFLCFDGAEGEDGEEVSHG